MRTNDVNLNQLFAALPVALLTLFLFAACEKREVSDLEKPAFPTNGTVFLDDFTPDLAYAAFGGSDVRAFQVDREVTYNASPQSMRFDVPDANSPTGSYAGGVFFSKTGRNLSGFNALTFYIKASQPANIGTLGFGNDLGANKYQVTLSGFPVNTNWKKVVIPIPDPAKLGAEKGLFYFATGPENDRGYTFWVDEVKFENLGSLGKPVSRFFNGRDSVISDAFFGETVQINRFETEVSLPTGINQVYGVSPSYFRFVSSDPKVASVNEAGIITLNDSTGSSRITAIVGKDTARGSATINFAGSDLRPRTKAPLPTRSPSNVISYFSDAYTPATQVVLNPYWQGSTTQSNEIKIQGDNVVRYFNMNYVAMVGGNTLNVNDMNAFHLDFWTPENVAGKALRIELVDFGPNGAFGGNDDRTSTLVFSQLASKSWVSIDVPLSAFSGPRPQGNLAQIVFSSSPNNSLTNVFIDNVYLYKIQTAPGAAAPLPTYPAANVLSVFSDGYPSLSGINLNPAWGQATVVSQTPIGGNNTLVYNNLNYQGLELGSNQDVSGMGFLHIDYYSVNSTALKVFVLSPGIPLANEISYTLPVPTNSGWRSIDVPLSHFTAPVNLSQVFQLKFEGNGTIYLDNILFRKD